MLSSLSSSEDRTRRVFVGFFTDGDLDIDGRSVFDRPTSRDWDGAEVSSSILGRFRGDVRPGTDGIGNTFSPDGSGHARWHLQPQELKERIPEDSGFTQAIGTAGCGCKGV